MLIFQDDVSAQEIVRELFICYSLLFFLFFFRRSVCRVSGSWKYSQVANSPTGPKNTEALVQFYLPFTCNFNALFGGKKIYLRRVHLVLNIHTI